MKNIKKINNIYNHLKIKYNIIIHYEKAHIWDNKYY